MHLSAAKIGCIKRAHQCELVFGALKEEIQKTRMMRHINLFLLDIKTHNGLLMGRVAWARAI